MIDSPLLHKNLITNTVLTTYVIGPRARIVQSWYLLALTLLFATLHALSFAYIRLPRFSNSPLIGNLYFGSLFPKRGAGWKIVRMTKHIHFFFLLLECFPQFFDDFQVYMGVNNSHLLKSKTLYPLYLSRPVSCTCSTVRQRKIIKKSNVIFFIFQSKIIMYTW